MPRKPKAVPFWTMDEARAQIDTMRPVDKDIRARLREGRTTTELDELAAAIGNDAERRLLLTYLARDDHALRKTAIAETQTILGTPFLDELTRRNTEMTSTTKAKKSGGTRTTKATDVQFVHDGKVMPESQNKFSSMAWFYTMGLGKGGGRLSTSEFKALLAKSGIDDPNKIGWTLKLDNGITVGTIRKGTTPAAVKPHAVKAPAAKKSTPRKATSTKKAPAKKATAAKKPAAKKAIAAASTRKRTTTKKVTR